MNPDIYSLKTTDERLLVMDHGVWYPAQQTFEAYIRDTFSTVYPCILGQSDIEVLLNELLCNTLPSRSCILLPLMAAALCYDKLTEYCREYQCLLVPLPLSRHPYVTFAFDPPELLEQTLSTYCSIADERWRTLPQILSWWLAKGGQQFVFLDINQSTGRAALLIETMLRRWLGSTISFRASILIEETTEQMMHAPGWRGGLKARIAEHRALRLVNHNTKYFSHLGYLQLNQDDQHAYKEAIHHKFPQLLSFWDNIPDDLQFIHGYDKSTEVIHKRRLHLRYSKSEDEHDVATKLHDIWDAHTIDTQLGVKEIDVKWRVNQMRHVLSIFPKFDPLV